MNVFYAVCFWEVKQDSQCTYNATLRRVRAMIVTVDKQWLLHNLNVCVCSLRYPECNAHAPHCRLCHVRLYNVLKHYLTNGTVFEKKVIEHKMWDIIFSKTFVRHISHSKKKSAIYIYIYVCVCVCVWLKMHIPFHVDFNGTFLDSFSKNTQLSNFTSICPVGAKLLHADGHTDTTKLTVAFGCFANASKNAIFGYTMW